MRPQGVAGALLAIAVGAILTYAVSFTMSGISIHTVGLIIMIVGVVALAILLVRSVIGLRRLDESRRTPVPQGLSTDAGYRHDSQRGAPPVALTRGPTDVYAAPGQRRVDQLPSAETYGTSGTARR